MTPHEPPTPTQDCFTALVTHDAAAAVEVDGRNLVFLVGSPRSGTTWLSRLMGAHPVVAATQEIELINRYCRPWQQAWDDQLPNDTAKWERHRHKGLPAVLTQEEFSSSLGAFARSVYDKMLALKPSAQVVVDKNPEYSLHVDLIRAMFPAAGLLHIVRDGRDVAASMVTASRGWGRDWAPSAISDAAQTWRANVEGAAAAAGSGRYLQVRYEDLIGPEGAVALARCLDFAGVASSRQECDEVLRRFSLFASDPERAPESLIWSGEVVKRLGAAPVEPSGFAGSGASQGWRQTWDVQDRLTFDAVAGDLLRTLGYEDDDAWLAAPEARRVATTAAVRAGHLASRIGWRLHTLLGQHGLYVHIARIQPYGREASRD